MTKMCTKFQFLRTPKFDNFCTCVKFIFFFFVRESIFTQFLAAVSNGRYVKSREVFNPV